MSIPDPKLMCSAGMALPEIQERLTQELRATQTPTAIGQLDGISRIAKSLPLRETSGLVEWYRLLAKTRHAVISWPSPFNSNDFCWPETGGSRSSVVWQISRGARSAPREISMSRSSHHSSTRCSSSMSCWPRTRRASAMRQGSPCKPAFSCCRARTGWESTSARPDFRPNSSKSDFQICARAHPVDRVGGTSMGSVLPWHVRLHVKLATILPGGRAVGRVGIDAAVESAQ